MNLRGNDTQEGQESFALLEGPLNRKHRIAIPAFPHLRILPGRGEDRPAGRAADQEIRFHEERRRSWYVRVRLREGENKLRWLVKAHPVGRFSTGSMCIDFYTERTIYLAPIPLFLFDVVA